MNTVFFFREPIYLWHTFQELLFSILYNFNEALLVQ